MRTNDDLEWAVELLLDRAFAPSEAWAIVDVFADRLRQSQREPEAQDAAVRLTEQNDNFWRGLQEQKGRIEALETLHSFQKNMAARWFGEFANATQRIEELEAALRTRHELCPCQEQYATGLCMPCQQENELLEVKS